MAANGNIYFSSGRPGAMGGPGDADVYRSRLSDGKYLTAEHLLDSVSCFAYELDCVVSPDESFLLIGFTEGRMDWVITIFSVAGILTASRFRRKTWVRR